MQQQDLSLLWAVAQQPHAADVDANQDNINSYHALHEMMHWAEGSGQPCSQPADMFDMDHMVNIDARSLAALEAEQQAVGTVTAEAAANQGQACVSLADLNEQQKAFVDAVLAYVNSPPVAQHDFVAPNIMFLRGGPGTGKTATLRVLMHLLDQCAVDMLVGATTAAAAQRLERPGQADTIDALMGVWVSRRFEALPHDSALRERLVQALLCICDEFSMLIVLKLMQIKTRLRNATKRGQPIKLLILCGDEQQIAPVCNHRRLNEHGYCYRCHLCFGEEWQRGKHFELMHVYRQAKDLPLLQFLNHCRKHTPTAERIKAVFQDCMAPESAFEDCLCPGVSVLCTHLDLVKDSNYRVLSWHAEHDLLDSEVFAVDADTNAWDCPDMMRWVKEQHLLTHVAEGAPVVFNINVNKARGQVNSARGVVTRVHTDGGGRYVTALTVRLDQTGAEVMVTRCMTHYRWHQGVQYHVHKFPVELAYALTAHKCQGMTLSGPVILRNKDCFAAGMLYVMLSRVTERRNLTILGEFRPDMFKRVKV